MEKDAIIEYSRKQQNEIVRLHEENERLREALANLIEHSDFVDRAFGVPYAHIGAARAALTQRNG